MAEFAPKTISETGQKTRPGLNFLERPVFRKNFYFSNGFSFAARLASIAVSFR